MKVLCRIIYVSFLSNPTLLLPKSLLYPSSENSFSQKSSKRGKSQIPQADLKAIESKLKQVEARNDHFEKLVVSKLDELTSTTSSISARPLLDRENKIHTTKVQNEVSALGDEISKMWKIIGEMDGKKSSNSPMDDPGSFGELAKVFF